MKNFKKLICTLLVLALMLGSFSTLAFADDKNALEEIVDNAVKDAVEEKIDDAVSDVIDGAEGLVNDILGTDKEETADGETGSEDTEEEKPLSQQPVLQVIWKIVKGAWKIVVSIFTFIINLITSIADKK